MTAAQAHTPLETRWPVTLLTGMLGSGKTTLLRHLLRQPAMRGAAVLINEIGEIGLDHHLVERVDGDVILMKSGCLCCTVRADLPQALSGLRRRWLNDSAMDFHSVIIETTGLAEPGPILTQLATNPLIAEDFPLSAVAVTVDAVHASSQLAARPEARRQVAVADLVVLTKTDLVSPARTRQVRRKIARLNPGGVKVSAIGGQLDAAAFTNLNPTRAEEGRCGEVARRWLADAPRHRTTGLVAQSAEATDHEGVWSISLRAEAPLDWRATQHCLAAVVSEFGPSLLRLKGLLDIVGSDRPVVVHGVHDTFYPLETLEQWPDRDRRSRLVLIVDGPASGRDRILELARSTGVGWRSAG